MRMKISPPVIAYFLLLAAGLAAEEQVPVGFETPRYQHVWERNPFTLVTPAAPQAQVNPFANLALISWLQQGSTQIVFVQNTETNEVQKVTPEPNGNGLSLVQVHANKNPQLFEAIISDGRQKGPVKFRFDVPQSGMAQVPGGAPNTMQTLPNGQPIPGQGVPGRFPNMNNGQGPAMPNTTPMPNSSGANGMTPRANEIRRKRMLQGPTNAPGYNQNSSNSVVPRPVPAPTNPQ